MIYADQEQDGRIVIVSASPAFQFESLKTKKNCPKSIHYL